MGDDLTENLGRAGLAVWHRFADEYVLDLREQSVLRLAADTADDVAALAALVADGAPVNARAELRMARTTLATLLGRLNLPDEDGVPRTAEALRKSKAAHARWDRTAEQRAERKRFSGA